ncbi:MAG: hypothetical protein JWO82_2126 [Akkermansiaceae bacterium]|nr:hypothetical protein [Akkermansiaceae bacterium]
MAAAKHAGLTGMTAAGMLKETRPMYLLPVVFDSATPSPLPFRKLASQGHLWQKAGYPRDGVMS